MANVFAQMDAQDGAPSVATIPANTNVPVPSSSGGNVFQQMDDAENPPAPSTSWSSLGKNLGAGVEELPASLASMAISTGKFLVGGYYGDDPAQDKVTGEITHKIGQVTGFDAAKVQPKTFPEKLARGFGTVLPQTLIPGEGEVSVANMLKNMATGAAIVTGATGAEEVVPDAYKPAAALAGGLMTAVTLHNGPRLVSRAAGALADAAAPVTAPIAARFSHGAAEAQAGSVLANRATNAGTVRDMLNAPTVAPADIIARANKRIAELNEASNPTTTAGPVFAQTRAAMPNLSGRLLTAQEIAERDFLKANINDPAALAEAHGMQLDTELVPGSRPTTFQQTGDIGLGALEREVATKKPDLFAARRGEQNSARLGALGQIQQGGDPNAVAGFLNNQWRDLDAQTSQHMDDLLTRAQEAAAKVGGNLTTDEYGEHIRGAVQTAEDAARMREKGLWQAVDPHGDLTGNVVQTRNAADDIASSLPKTAKPMSGEEGAIFHAAQEMPDLAPVQDLIALRSRVSTEMRNELITNGRSPSYARLTQLRGAIQDNLNNTISEKIANEAGLVSRGAINPEDATLAKLQEWQNEFYNNRAAAAGDVGGASARAPSGEGTTPAASVNGTVIPPERGFGGTPGASGLPGYAPTFDAAGAERLAAATAATKERARTFGMNPVGPMLAKAGASDLYKLQEARVPQRFFHPGPTGFDDMQALYRSIGQEGAIPVIQDYAASSLRRAAMREDGTLDPRKYAVWKAAHADSLRALPPDVQARFSTAADASRAVTDATRLREIALKDAQKGAIGRLMGATNADEVVGRIGAILGSKTAVADIRELARVASKDPLATQGLRQAVADHIAKKFISNTEAGTSGQNLIKADAFQSFVKQNRVALNAVFKPEEVQNIEAIAADINRAKRSENAIKLPGGSNTAQDTLGVRTHDRQTSPSARRFIDMIGAYAGSHFGGPIGTFFGLFGADAIQSMRAAGIDRVDQLVTKAMLDPRVAKELLNKVPTKAAPKTSNGLARAIRASTASATLMAGAQ